MGASINYRVNPDKATSLEIQGWGIDKYEIGAIVFNTTLNALVTYTGSMWVVLEETTSAVVFITEDYLLPDSNTITSDITIKNPLTTALNVLTQAADKFEGEDTQIIYGGESFTITKYTTNDYRII